MYREALAEAKLLPVEEPQVEQVALEEAAVQVRQITKRMGARGPALGSSIEH